MKLTRVKLSGFKSFIDPVELRVLPGLTGVVGPNGCGKSNLFEAIRWAMGEGSPKSLRGAGMDDVIFAGTATRPQRQFAEVSILAETAGDEVEITRRIERGAGSAWRINGRDARARDAQLIFADAATGAHSPALVSQGRIGAVIAAKPAERRAMLEEAAGIAGLHVRRREAEIRLKATETNLTRIAEVVGELEVRAGALRRQARSAERYRKLSDAIRTAEGRLIFARWRDAAAAADIARADAAQADAQVAAASEAQRVAAALARAANEALVSARSSAQAARDAAADARHALASAEGEMRAVETRLAGLLAERDRLAADREREGELARDAGEALLRLADEVAELTARCTAGDEARPTLVARVEGSERASRDAEVALAKATAEVAERSAERRVAEAALAAARLRFDRSGRDHARAVGERDALPALEGLAAELHAGREAAAAADAEVASAVAAIATTAQTHDAAGAQLAKQQAALGACAATLAALESEARALAPTRDETGALALVTATPGFEVALAAALADDLAAEVGTGATGSRRWTGATGDDDPALPCGTALADHVTAPAELARRLLQIAVVDVDQGVELAVGQRLVTRDGCLRRWDGFVSEGTGAIEAERLVRRNRLMQIERELPRSRQALADGERGVADARAAVAAAAAAHAASRAARDAAESLHRARLREVDAALARHDRAVATHRLLGERIAALAGEVESAATECTGAQALLDALPAVDHSRELAAIGEVARTARDVAGAARAELAALDARIATDRARRDRASAEAESWRARSGKAAKRVEDMARRAAALDADAEAMADAPDAAARRVRRAGVAATTASDCAETALAAERDAETKVREREAVLTQAGEILAGARETRAGAVARAENQELRRVEMGRVAGERFECPPPVLPERLGFDAAAVGATHEESARLESHASERERLGPVNLVADAELAEVEAARDANAADVAELTEATHRLRGSIGNLNREGRIKLRAAFDAVDAHFRDLFATLFNGGEAHLELIDSEDPLDAGLEIMAQPPGKKLTSLTLLSGGEQALTAVALIFALFLTNPAPLCVLDEVDAPLDDANVERFCDLLDRVARDTDTRFLIVTHNAVTMARMHRLYGVTMVEQGVSRLVSVDLGGATELLAAE